MNLAGFGSLLAPAEPVEQQVIGRRDGGGPVAGDRVYDIREGVAESLRHVRQHRWVEILWTQPGKQFDRRQRVRRRETVQIIMGSLERSEQ